MEIDPEFKFDVTLSHKGYDHKPTNVDYRTMQWIRRKLSLNDFVAFIAEGYSYCHIYFGSRRVKAKFKQTQTVSIDVDESEVSLKDFIANCSPKPTFAYETFSNNNGKRKYRYRLVYIFKEPLNGNAFVQMYDTICNMIGLATTKDHCGRVLSQLMNGTSKKAYIYRSNIIYSSVTDIVVPDTESHAVCSPRGLFPRKTHNPLTPITNPFSITIPAENSCNNNIIYHNNKKQYSPKVRNRTNIFEDLREPLELLERDRKGFLDFYGKIFKLTRWSKLTYNEFGYCVIPDTHLSLYVRYCYTDGAYRISRFKDGEKRRNKLFIDGCLIRKIKPEITALELLYNLVHRVHYYYDNSDGLLSNFLILDKVAAVMEYDVNAMEFKSLDAGRVTTSPGYCTQNNITRLSHSRKALMMENYKSISEWYDPTKSVVENFNYAMSNNIEISERTLRRYCHFNDLPLSPKRIEPSEWYDRGMSVKSNMKLAA